MLEYKNTAGRVKSIQFLSFWDGRKGVPREEHGQSHDVGVSPPFHHQLRVGIFYH